MTDFNRGDMVSARKYVVEQHPAYADQVGRVVGARSVGRKRLIDVEWLGELRDTEWPGSYLKLVTGTRAASALRDFEREAEVSDDNYVPAPAGETLDTGGFVPPETQSDDVRAGRVVIDVVEVSDAENVATITLGDQEVEVDADGNEVKPLAATPLTEPLYGRCNGLYCNCEDYVPGKKIGTWEVCRTCAHTTNIHRVRDDRAGHARRGNI